ncbi:Uncharacterised protein [Vibrio cholerae]|nr:Uncharacterised protein [Vibrio cholerae]CSD04646.1 Uncharacterised protein [Vibrio cholerae]
MPLEQPVMKIDLVIAILLCMRLLVSVMAYCDAVRS